jgi:hypothetical protein
MVNMKKTWNEYLAVLGRLDQVVKKQTIVLENEDLNNLALLFGQKENAYLSLQMAANQLEKPDKSDKYPNYSEFKIKANQLIHEIQKTETLNKDLLVDLMQNTKKQSNDLKKYSDKTKTYLSSVGVKRNRNLNLVS